MEHQLHLTNRNGNITLLPTSTAAAAVSHTNAALVTSVVLPTAPSATCFLSVPSTTNLMPQQVILNGGKQPRQRQLDNNINQIIATTTGGAMQKSTVLNTAGPDSPTYNIVVTTTAIGGGAAAVVEPVTASNATNAAAIAVMQANSGLPSSLLIRNQPKYVNTKTTPRNIAKLPILNQDLVKQIVVGNAPVKAKSTLGAVAKTLLKPQYANQKSMQQLQQPLQKRIKTHNTLMDTKEASKLQTYRDIAPKPSPSPVQSSSDATSAANATKTNNAQTFVDLFKSTLELPTGSELLKIRRPPKVKAADSIDAKEKVIVMQTIVQDKLPTIKDLHAYESNNNNINKNNKNNSSDVKEDSFNNSSSISKIKQHTQLPTMPNVEVTNSATSTTDASTTATTTTLKNVEPLQIKALSKQKSLLKAKTVRDTSEGNVSQSPRSKRSKSLNSALLGDGSTSTERRHSIAYESGKRNAKNSCLLQEKLLQQHLQVKHKVGEVVILKNREDVCNSIEYLDDFSEGNLIIDESRVTNEINEGDECDALDGTGETINSSIQQANAEDDSTNKCLATSHELNKDDACPLLTSPQIKIELNESEITNKQTLNVVSNGVIANANASVKDVDTTPVAVTRTQTNSFDDKSLLCDEQIPMTPSSASNCSSNNSLHDNTINVIKEKKSTSNANGKSSSDVGSYSSVVNMLSTFNMLTWKERIGNARGTNMRFQLNEFNLLQVHERCPTRQRIHTAYEKPIYEREALPQLKEQADPLLYLCRRCNCHGPAQDFLAPEFCSLECIKRDARKRQREHLTASRKRSRKDPLKVQQQMQLPSDTFGMPPKKHFRWSTYLSGKCGAIAAPVDLFLNPFPTGPNFFQIGMKLEAIDPENCSLFCVCTVVDMQGYRLKLTFDGYECMYDFWVNADSMDIFPPGWCAKTNRILQPPKSVSPLKFNWLSYIAKYKAVPALRQLFTHLNSSSMPTHNPFKIGMHLEAEDLNDTGKLCVARVADVLDDRIRIHFDGWDDCYDYWVDISSPYIHPCGWHVGRQQLIVPPDFETASFNWPDYIRNHGSGTAAHDELFVAREPINFKPHMKLEVVDPRNPSLIRPASVVGRKGHRVKLHLDCWPSDHCFWLEDDSPDLHPIGWCDATGHDLEPPPGFQMRQVKMPCDIPGCRGIGNAKRLYMSSHAMRDCCPYAPENWRQKMDKPPRLDNHEIVTQVTLKTSNSKPVKSQAQHQKQRHMNEKRILESVQILDHIKTRRLIPEKRQSISTRALEHSEESGPLEKLLAIKQEFDTTVECVSSSSVSTTAASTSSNSVNGDAQLQGPFLNIAKRFLCDYGPRLQQNYETWQRNLDFDFDKIKENPLRWSVSETSAFVENILSCINTAEILAAEDIDGAALLMLEQTDLTELLGLKLGPAVKLYSYILQLRTLAVAKFGVKMCKSERI